MPPLSLRSCLRRFHMKLVDTVEPIDVVDFLFHSKVITENEMEELVEERETRRTRCRRLLAIVRRRVYGDPTVLLRFVDALHESYKWLSSELRQAVDDYMSSDSDALTCYDHVTDRSSDDDDDVLDWSDNAATVGKRREKEKRIDRVDDDTSSSSSITVICTQRIRKKSTGQQRHRQAMLDNAPRKQVVSTQLAFYAQLVQIYRRRHSVPSLNADVFPPSDYGKSTKVHQQIFCRLSHALNQGLYGEFQKELKRARALMQRDVNIACMVLYLDACRSVTQMDYKHAKETIKCALDLVPKTSSPNRVTVELLAVKCWMYLKRTDRIGKAESTLTEAINIIRQDPVTCSGKAAGWIYVNDARVKQQLIGSSNCCSVERINALRQRAMDSLRTAMAHFLNDDTVEGRPYGFNFASVKLSSLTIACDENLHLLSMLKPTQEEMTEAASLIKTVDESKEGILLNLRPLHLMALADYKFRSGLTRRAHELSLEGFAATKKLNLPDELCYARVRCERYGSRESVKRVASKKGSTNFKSFDKDEVKIPSRRGSKSRKLSETAGREAVVDDPCLALSAERLLLNNCVCRRRYALSFCYLLFVIAFVILLHLVNVCPCIYG